MGQRLKNQNIWTQRQNIQKGKPKRAEKQVNVRPLLLMACEGVQTEPNYLNAYLHELKVKHVISARSYFIVPHKHTDPCGVLKDLLNYQDGGLKASDFERKWIFIDRDEIRTNEQSGHTKENFNQALENAERKKVKVAWSNPCFEIWFLLHFVCCCTPVDRADLPAKIESYTGKEYQKNSKEMFLVLREKIVDAIANARRLEENCTNPPCDANPMTTVHKFFEENNAATLETDSCI